MRLALLGISVAVALGGCNPTASLKLAGDGWEDASLNGRSFKICRSQACGGRAAVMVEDKAGGPIQPVEADVLVAIGNAKIPTAKKEIPTLRGFSTTFKRQNISGLEAIAFTGSGKFPEVDPLEVFAKGERMHVTALYAFVRSKRRVAFAAARTQARASALAQQALIAE